MSHHIFVFFLAPFWPQKVFVGLQDCLYTVWEERRAPKSPQTAHSHFARACAAEMHLNIPQESLNTGIYTKKLHPTSCIGPHLARVCAVEMNVNIRQDPFHTRIYRKNAGDQNEHHNPSTAFTPAVGTYQCGQTLSRINHHRITQLPHRHTTKSSYHHMATSQNHHVTTPPHHITTSHHHITSPHHHITSPYHVTNPITTLPHHHTTTPPHHTIVIVTYFV